MLRMPISDVFAEFTVTLIPADGVGVEISESVKAIFAAEQIPVKWEEINTTGVDTGGKTAEVLLVDCIASLKKTRVGLKGTFYTSTDTTSHESLNVVLRRELDLYASLTLLKNIPNVKTRHSNIDISVVRENIQGEYSGLEHCVVPGVVEALKIVSGAQTERVVNFALTFASSQNRKKVTCVHKANILKLSDGQFRDSFIKLAESHPHLNANDMIVDNACMQAVVRPQNFDVVVLPNLYASIFSNIVAAYVGGVGVVPSGTFGDDIAVFEPGCRHAGLDIKGKGRANPIAMILSACMMLRYLNLNKQADRIEKAVFEVVQTGLNLTPDLGGNGSTKHITNSIIKQLKATK